MAQTDTIPAEFRDFFKIFSKIADRHDYSRVFEDFLDMMIKGFSSPGIDYSKQNQLWQSRYKLEERHSLGKLIFEYLRLMEKQLILQEWYDGFGIIYETISSNFKRSGLGQFFTPPSVVDLMVKINGIEKVTGQKLNDCACGSGRFLIAHHAAHPGNLYFGEDIDPICCKMSVLNMLLHGCVGQVINHDSLHPDSFFQGWIINRHLNITGIPMIQQMEKPEPVKPREEIQKPKFEFAEPIEKSELEAMRKEAKQPVQLSLF